MNIWEVMYEKFIFNKEKITLFESFSGIGSQHAALDLLAKEFGFELDVIGISEIDKYAIQSYNAIHGVTKNYGSITDIKEIPQVDIFTYSFPCQDISLAGNQKGFSRGSKTRSGLLWEVERILENQEKINKLPKILLMENVKALVGMKFKDDFIEWQLKLESLGYRNYWEVLNAKDYGIPQNRERVFMISVLGEYHYTFPKPFPLKLRLKDMLENEVDEKYYLSNKMMKYLTLENDKYTGNNGASYINKSVASCITTREGNTRADASNYLSAKLPLDFDLKTLEKTNESLQPKNENNIVFTQEKNNTNVIGTLSGGKWDNTLNASKRVFDIEKTVGTITAMGGGNQEPKILINEATKKGYTEATDGDGVYINRPHQKRGVVQKGMIQTIKTSPDIGVVVKGNYSPSGHNASRIVDEKGIAPTVMENHGTVTGVLNNLRIRKLTPKECWRLMGFKDSDFDKAAKVCSNSQLYKQAGNSIVVDVLYYIFKELFKGDD